jgi:hypothetical protein
MRLGAGEMRRREIFTKNYNRESGGFQPLAMPLD